MRTSPAIATYLHAECPAADSSRPSASRDCVSLASVGPVQAVDGEAPGTADAIPCKPC
jgi:hypothetical protein